MTSPSEPVEQWCSCGMYATVMDDAPDPGCPFHGEKGIQVWTTCTACGRKWRAVAGHSCPSQSGDSGGD